MLNGISEKQKFYSDIERKFNLSDDDMIKIKEETIGMNTRFFIFNITHYHLVYNKSIIISLTELHRLFIHKI